ncbi:filament-like plant protein [Musa acuminata AAA Group]|uniref:filament-like plant protein n=1 Tax=Musa acuminata AAA Group TaxID=214697 RepID=UPI0031DB1CB6
MSPRETEISGSLSSSQAYWDEPEVSRASAANSSPSDAQSADDSLKDVDVEVGDTTNGITEKLAAALVSIRSKEDLVKQHAKVAEEALLGWEKSEKESTYLRQQLKTAMQKNTSLEEKLGHLDDALKECVRQLRQSKEEQAEKVQDAIFKKTCEWESLESELEARFTELQTQLEAKTESYNSLNHELCSKVETLEKENASLKVKLTALTEDLHVRTLEMDLSIRAAETASKQHLEGIKKMAKLEAECRSLRARIQKPSLSNDHRFICNSLYGESLTDSQSDSGERLFGLENELSVPDSWASALIAELDQFKNEKSSARNLTSPVEIDLMDDFLEMERLAALTEIDYGSSSFEHEADLDVAIPRQRSPRSSPETMRQQMAVLEEKIEKMTIEKGNMETSIAQTNCQLKTSCNQLVVAEGELVELHRQLNLVNGEKHTLEIELEIAEAKRKKMGLELDTAHKEIGDLKHRLNLLEKRVDEEKPLSKKFTGRCQNMEVDAERKEMESELESAYGDHTNLQDNTDFLKVEFEEKRLSAECTYRYQNLGTLEEKRKDLESQIESANLELSKLHEKFDRTENKIEMFCFDSCPSMDAVDEKGTQLEYQTNSANLEVHKLQEKVDLSEAEAEEQVRPSAEFESDIESLEAKKMELVVQLELEHMEVRSLQEKVQILEKQIEKEKRLTAEFAARCHTLEDELSTKQQSETQQSANSTASLNIRQEKEVAQAAGRLAKCQKTIASLNLQLKTLATLDDFLVQTETPESSGKTVELKVDSSEKPGGSSALCNGAQSLPSADCRLISSPIRSNDLIQTKYICH